jgi:N-acetylglucosamine-6-sulfatase
MQPHTTHGHVSHILIVLAAMALAVVGLMLAGDRLLTDTQRAEAQTDSRPNFVFVMTDDLDEQSMQQLPGITSLMRGDPMSTNGITFENAYVTYSLCCPSRATILRGQYPHNHGILGNHPPLGGEGKFREPQLGLDKSTVATWLNDAGYQTKYIGKYMNGYDDLYKPSGWDEWFALQGSSSSTQVNDDGRSVQLAGHSTDVFANEASDFITRGSANPEPFFVLIGTKAPHRPPEVANRYKDRFATTPLPRPDNFNEEDVSDKAQWLQAYPRLSQAEIDDTQQLYRERLRSMLSVEDLLRQTIDTLQQTDELDNTYIFFTSDNGFHLGQHRLTRGKRTSYEEDIGIPLMVRGPRVPAAEVRQQLVLNNDFAPTIADLADASTPAFVDGSSFAPLLTGSPPSSWRTAFLEEGTLETIGSDTPTPTHKSVHTRQHVFVEYAKTAEHELYDLALDPYQLQSRPRAGNAPLYDEMQARLNALRNCSGSGCRVAEGFPDDSDGDGVADATDNCPEVANADQVDTDGDGVGDACEGTPPIDTTDPQITITTPPQGATYTLGQSVAASYSCTDADSGVASCQGSVDNGANIDTSSVGTKTFTVDATDNATNTNSVSHTYTVNAQTTSCTKSGTSNSETISGTSGADVICGLGGNDTIEGRAGDDELRGGDGADKVTGNGGADTLYGENGNDTLNSRDGVSGNDSLDGGAGTDKRTTDPTEKSITGFP